MTKFCDIYICVCMKNIYMLMAFKKREICAMKIANEECWFLFGSLPVCMEGSLGKRFQRTLAVLGMCGMAGGTSLGYRLLYNDIIFTPSNPGTKKKVTDPKVMTVLLMTEFSGLQLIPPESMNVLHWYEHFLSLFYFLGTPCTHKNSINSFDISSF